jgi:hypothetical protein
LAFAQGWLCRVGAKPEGRVRNPTPRGVEVGVCGAELQGRSFGTNILM